MAGAVDIEIRPRKTVGYRIFRAIVVGAWRIMFRPTVIGLDNVPQEGPVVLAPIHRSNIDFAFTVFMTKRKAFFMAKDSIFKVPGLNWLVSTMGAFPVKRGTADRESLRLAQSVLERGLPLVIFPEGTRQEGDAVGPLHDGAVYVAAKCGAPIVPIGIGHTERAMPRGSKFPRPVKVSVVIGAPLAPVSGDGRPARSAISAATEELRVALEKVYAEAMSR